MYFRAGYFERSAWYDASSSAPEHPQISAKVRVGTQGGHTWYKSSVARGQDLVQVFPRGASSRLHACYDAFEVPFVVAKTARSRATFVAVARRQEALGAAWNGAIWKMPEMIAGDRSREGEIFPGRLFRAIRMV